MAPKLKLQFPNSHGAPVTPIPHRFRPLHARPALSMEAETLAFDVVVVGKGMVGTAAVRKPPLGPRVYVLLDARARDQVRIPRPDL